MSTPPPLDDAEFGRWRDEADRALHGARLQADAQLHNWACFAAEQAAQLAVKGLLHGLGRGPWGHDLVRLGQLLREAGAHPPHDVDDALRRLGRHYIPARYPDAHALGPPGMHYGAADAREAMADASRIIAFVDRTWQGHRG
ncbi:MAG: HEPN domain-containing protein [Actinomycetota bacterium]|nr:HEPN domain-containing protein [Actinomycetota bacterium]